MDANIGAIHEAAIEHEEMNNVGFENFLILSSTISPVSHTLGVESTPNRNLKQSSFVGVPHEGSCQFLKRWHLKIDFPTAQAKGDGRGYM